MGSGTVKFSILFLILFCFNSVSFAQCSADDGKEKLIEYKINILKNYLYTDSSWQLNDTVLQNNISQLIYFVEHDPIDSVLLKLNTQLKDTSLHFVYRLPENVSDSLFVPGYYAIQNIEDDFERIRIDLERKQLGEEIRIPDNLISNSVSIPETIPSGEGMKLFADSIYTLPDSLKPLDIVPDSLLDNEENFRKLLKTDSLRFVYVERKRLEYNDSLANQYRDLLVNQYQTQFFEENLNRRKSQFLDSVRLNNYQVLKNYNDSVMQVVNDSIYLIVKELSEYANFIDTTRINILNTTNDSTWIVLGNQNIYGRIWVKNQQNDSLSVLLGNPDKNTIQLFIDDDGARITRFRQNATKNFDTSLLPKNTDKGMNDLKNRYKIETPWKLGGDGTIGFTQTYISKYWKKGGQSALSLLIVLKGSANYSRNDGKIKWENSVEVRNGWIRPGGSDSELQKNDDRFEITSRFGVNAFKKWFYSAEVNYETQFFYGYRYPTSVNPSPISAFMSPAKTFFKLGLDYKPGNNFSLLLSPLSVKNVFVRDTSLIDQTKFGVEPDRKSFWEPGLNADVYFNKNITDDISYETKYKMFLNYKEPFKKFDINWENLLVMKMNDYIDVRLMIHMIYDDDVLFPVYDSNDVQVGEKPKLQFKQLITVGFSYSINRNVMKLKKL